MKPEEFRSSIWIKKGGELNLPGNALGKLMQSVLDKGIPFRFQAKGFSMHPFIKDGDIITLSPFSGSSLRLGDVVAFIHSETGKPVIHRMIGKKDGSYFEKGDNIYEAGSPVTEASLCGTVTRVERNGRKVFFGLGPERYLIALLSRTGFRFGLFGSLWKSVSTFTRRFL